MSPPIAKATPVSGARGIRVAGAGLVLLTLLAYARSFSGEFVFDDQSAIELNPSVRNLADWRAILSPPAESTMGGRPLANFSFALNYAISGMQTWSYRALNIVLHAANVLLLFGIVRRTLQMNTGARNASAGTSAGWSRSGWLAAAAAALWAVHPLGTSTVCYISQRTEALMATCYLGTLYSFIRGTRSSSSTWLAGSVASCALGMTSKEVMVTAPFLVLLYDRTFVAGSFRAALGARRGYYAALASTYVLLAYLLSGLEARSVGFGLGVPWWKYGLSQFEAITTYVRLAIWPAPLVFDYGPQVFNHLSMVLPQALLVLALAAGALLLLARRTATGFLLGAVLIVLAPTSSVVPIALQPIAENRAYLPLAPICVLLALGAGMLPGRWAASALVSALAAFSSLTLARSGAFHDNIALWRDTIAKRPENPRARNNLGYFLQLRGNPEALLHYQAAVDMAPDFAPARVNYALVLAEIGRAPEAILHAREALRLEPRSAPAHAALAMAFNALGQSQDAIREAQQALELTPRTPVAHSEIGKALMQLNQPAEAIAHFLAELQLRPNHAAVHSHLGAAYYRAGRITDAVDQFQSALRLQPAYPEAEQNLASALSQLGQLEPAIRHYRAVLQVRPEWHEARTNLALVLGRSGRFAEAEAELLDVLAVAPNHAAAQHALYLVREAAQSVAREPR